ncbi:MAG: SCP2 sterol-binding domain-containing protein [Actinomycetota bacterium]|nr:SCP2 sterol-binding domain-containing protein [Actinomycetota bacterium]
MPTYEFLSEEWLVEARSIRAEYEGKVGPVAHQVRMNLVITEVPFGEGAVHAHMDTSGGELVLDTGHIDPVDLNVTLEYAVAKAILIEGNPQAGMQAFMSGKIRVDGDISKLMAMQTGVPDPSAAEVAARLKAITA